MDNLISKEPIQNLDLAYHFADIEKYGSNAKPKLTAKEEDFNHIN